MNLVDLDLENEDERCSFKVMLGKYLKELYIDSEITITDDLIEQAYIESISDLEGEFKHWIYICYDDNIPIGFGIAQVDNVGGNWCLKPGYGMIREFYIEKHSRRKGYGSELYKFIEDILRREEVSKIYLTTDSMEGIEFWDRQGYSFTGEICPLNNSGIYEKLCITIN